MGEWASVSGTAVIITDRDVVRKYYSPALKAWLGDLGDGKHDGGPEDPRIGVIKVTAKTATYAITSSTFITRGLEIAKGMVTGESPKVNKLREITEEELKECEYTPLILPLYLDLWVWKHTNFQWLASYGPIAYLLILRLVDPPRI